MIDSSLEDFKSDLITCKWRWSYTAANKYEVLSRALSWKLNTFVLSLTLSWVESVCCLTCCFAEFIEVSIQVGCRDKLRNKLPWLGLAQSVKPVVCMQWVQFEYMESMQWQCACMQCWSDASLSWLGMEWFATKTCQARASVFVDVEVERELETITTKRVLPCHINLTSGLLKPAAQPIAM